MKRATKATRSDISNWRQLSSTLPELWLSECLCAMQEAPCGAAAHAGCPKWAVCPLTVSTEKIQLLQELQCYNIFLKSIAEDLEENPYRKKPNQTKKKPNNKKPKQTDYNLLLHVLHGKNGTSRF